MDNTNTTPNNGESVASESVVPGQLLKNRPKLVKIGVIVLAVLVLGGLLYSIKGLFLAAIVDGHPITRYSVVKELERQGGKDALDTIIDKKLIGNEAEAKNISVSTQEIDEEMKRFEDQFSTGEQTLDDALAAEGLTRDDLKEQIFIRKQIEKLIGDKGDVSDEELQAYMTENKITLPAGQEETTKNQIKDQLRQQKLAQFSGELLEDLRSKANIRTFVDYKGAGQAE